jgi:hypothetical protein
MFKKTFQWYLCILITPELQRVEDVVHDVARLDRGKLQLVA